MLKVRLKPAFLNYGVSLFSVPVGRDEASKKIEEVMDTFEHTLADSAELLKPDLIEKDTDLKRFKAETTHIVDALLLYVMAGAPHRIAAGLSVLNKPIIMTGAGVEPLDATANIRARGREAYAPLDLEELKEVVTLLRVRKVLRSSRVLVFTSMSLPSFTVVSSAWDTELIREKFGPEIKIIPNEKLFEEMEKVSMRKAEELADKWMKEAAEVKVVKEHVVKPARLYLALESMLDEFNANALAIGCGERVFLDRNVTPCVACTVLKDRGIPVACEADLSTLLAMMILMILSKKPALMGNLRISSEEIIQLFHDVPPLRMDGFEKPPTPYILYDFHDRGFSASIYTEMRIGQKVTMARFNPTLTNLLAARGEIVRCFNGVPHGLCRETVEIRVHNAKSLLHEAANYGHHFVVIYGDYISQLKRLCETFNVKIVVK